MFYIVINSNESKAKILYHILYYLMFYFVIINLSLSYFTSITIFLTMIQKSTSKDSTLLLYCLIKISFAKYFDYCTYYVSFVSNWLIIFNTKIFSKLVCFYYTLIIVTNQIISQILTNIRTFIIMNPLTCCSFVYFKFIFSSMFCTTITFCCCCLMT